MAHRVAGFLLLSAVAATSDVEVQRSDSPHHMMLNHGHRNHQQSRAWEHQTEELSDSDVEASEAALFARGKALRERKKQFYKKLDACAPADISCTRRVMMQQQQAEQRLALEASGHHRRHGNKHQKVVVDELGRPMPLLFASTPSSKPDEKSFSTRSASAMCMSAVLAIAAGLLQ
eukprot:gnl/TRDRNA2_/TRDRNA2_187747_c0_seq1.p1 gnl/TRDRNA2_/TRDRNA2_187747_c0~~gnl/TRDRNA2_/TRDRNA2_187747_c0_seq1.p1  ORF type:complete len:190 (-),score=44.33 gnl/TRDRNA2_/TRDRNA2_187747_c0_seq1:122-646(-)